MKVQNMTSSRGNVVANQFIIENAIQKVPNLMEKQIGTMFQSYDSSIVFKTSTNTYLDKTFWDYSTTTGKYRNIFLGETKAETQKKIDSGEYKLTNLN